MEVEERYIDFDGKKVFYRCSMDESRETAFLLHGMRFSSKNWSDIDGIRKISQWGYNVLAVDYPGFGQSEEITEYRFSGDDYSPASRFVRDFCKKLGIKDLTIIGPSMGGGIAMKTLIDYPDLVKQVIAIAPAGFDAMRGELYRIDKPVHLFWGSKDDTIDISYGRKYHDFIAGSTLTVIKGADHVPYLKKTSQFFSLIKKFLLDE